MQRQLNVAVRNLDGTVHERVIHETDKNGVHIVDKETGAFKFKAVEPKTLRSYCMDALGGVYKGEEDMSGEDRLKRFQLGMKIADAGEGPVDLTSDDGSKLAECVRKAFSGPNSNAIYGRLRQVLDEDPPRAEASAT